MRIASIELRNYRLFRDVKLTDLPPAAVFVGANGSGKSTLFDALSFLQDALAENVAAAVARRGGFKELVSRGEDGPIRITVHLEGNDRPLNAYRIDVASENDRPVVRKEVLAISPTSADPDDSTHVVEVARGKGRVVASDILGGPKSETREFELEHPSALAIKGLSQFKEFRAAARISDLLQSWHVSNIHVHDAHPSPEAGYAEHLSARGDNVAQVAHYLYEHHPDRFRRILDLMRARVPGVTAVEARPTIDGRLVLRFQDGSFEDPFVARHVSDGTIKMFAYLVLLHDPKPHPLLAVEEPENQLHPALLRELAEEFRDYARRGGQVLVSTHSPEFLNGAKLDEIYWFVKKDGFATIRRASDSKLLRDLYAEGDPPGALWKQRLFEGADPE